MTQEVGPELRARVEEIRGALDAAGDRLEPALADRARTDLDRVLERLELGVDHAVVALVGGTGSGKSSMFNAITTLPFADVGVIRPTTSQAAACVWGEGADRLLDFLQVSKERRFLRESALTGTDEAQLRGLVLLDLPDHDSVATGHAELVNRLLPLIDLLVWVVDPQKYADNALHEGYLRELQDRHEAMIVVVNQVDTLTETGAKAVREDVGRLLADDGLADVAVLLASARTGEGVPEVRAHLRDVLASESMAARTARDEIGAVVRRLRAGIGDADPTPPAVEGTATAIADAAGVPAVATALQAAVESTSPVTTSGVQRPAKSRLDAIRDGWLGDATTGLPARWRDAVRAAAAPAEDFAERASTALESVRLPDTRDHGAARRRVAGIVLLVLGLVVAAASVVPWVLPDLLVLDQVVMIAASALGVLLVVIGFVLIQTARARRRRSGAERVRRYRSDLASALGTVVKADLLAPTTEVLADHGRVRRGVLGSSTGSR